MYRSIIFDRRKYSLMNFDSQRLQWPALAVVSPLILLLAGCDAKVAPTASDKPAASEKPAAPTKLAATTFDSGFVDGHDTYNGISAASDGNIYYALSSDKIDVAAQMFCY